MAASARDSPSSPFPRAAAPNFSLEELVNYVHAMVVLIQAGSSWLPGGPVLWGQFALATQCYYWG